MVIGRAAGRWCSAGRSPASGQGALEPRVVAQRDQHVVPAVRVGHADAHSLAALPAHPHGAVPVVRVGDVDTERVLGAVVQRQHEVAVLACGVHLEQRLPGGAGEPPEEAVGSVEADVEAAGRRHHRVHLLPGAHGVGERRTLDVVRPGLELGAEPSAVRDGEGEGVVAHVEVHPEPVAGRTRRPETRLLLRHALLQRHVGEERRVGVRVRGLVRRGVGQRGHRPG